MRYTQKQQDRGFTLVEMLIYVAVLVLISGAVVMTYLSLTTTLLRNEAARELNHAATTVFEQLLHDMRAASAVNTTERMLPNELALDIGLSTTTEYYLMGGRVYLDINNETVGPLTSEKVTVESLEFTHYQNFPAMVETEAIRVELVLSVESRAASTTKTFYTGAVLRGTYE